MKRPQLLAILGFLAVAACDLTPAGVTFDGLPMGPGPYVLLDDYLFETVVDVERVVRQPTRDPAIPNPLVTGPEDGNIAPFMTILREAGGFRLWYNAAVDELGTDASFLGYLESVDGIHWERPRTILPGPPGGIRFGASIVPRPEGGYAFGYHQDGGLRVATSADGLTWNAIHDGELIQQDHDITGLTYDPIRKEYIAIVSTLRTENGGGPAGYESRQTQISVSKDLLNWVEPWDVIVPDFRDEEGTQFYAMDGFLARGDLLIGMVKILRDDLTAVGGVGGMGWTSLIWTRDGRTWHRDRAIFLGPDPEPGTWDHAHAWIDQQVPVGDEVYLYYGGYAAGHKGERETDRSIGLVKMPRDRYVGWAAGAGGGVLTTRPVRIEGGGLSLNVDAAGGEVRVRVLSVSDRKVIGECEPIRVDALEVPVVCDVSLAALDEAVRLEIELRDATLFAMVVG